MVDPLILVRGVHIATTVLASGTVCFITLVADVPALRRRMNLTVWLALAVAILSGTAWLALLAADILGGSLADVCLHGGVWQVAAGTRFGMVWCMRLVLAVLLGALMLLPGARWPRLIAAAGLIALLGAVGHAGATPGWRGDIHLAADIAHLLAAAGWLGALPALAMLLIQARGKTRLRASATAATRRFSRLGIVCVATLLASAAVNSWNLLGGPSDLVATDYGRLVLLKIGLFAAMIGIAVVNKYHLTPRLPASGALNLLQRNSEIEIALGLIVMLFVGALGTMAPPGHVHMKPAAIPPDAAFVHIHDAEAMADVTIDPGRAGRVTATIHVMREDASELTVKLVTLVLDPPHAGGKTIERAAQYGPDGNWRVNDVEVPQAGIWTVRVIVTPATGPPIVLDAPIVIER